MFRTYKTSVAVLLCLACADFGGAVSPVRRPYSTRPPVGAVVQAGSSLAQGLVYFIPHSDQGAYPTEYFTKTLPTVSGSNNAPAWQSTSDGYAIFYTFIGGTNMAWLTYANNAAFVLSGTFTFAVRFRANSWNGLNAIVRSATYFDLTYNNFQGQGNNWLSCQYYDGSGNIKRVGVTSLPSTGVWHTMVVTVVANVPTSMYLDGVALAVTTGSGAGVRSTTAVLELGGNANGAGQSDLDGNIDYFAMWNRLLSVNEIRALQVNRYAMLIPPSPSPWWMTTAGAAPPATNNAFYFGSEF